MTSEAPESLSAGDGKTFLRATAAVRPSYEEKSEVLKERD